MSRLAGRASPRSRALVQALAGVLLAFVLTAPAAIAGIKDQLRVVTEDGSNGVKRLVASNDGPAPVSIWFALVESENFASDRAWPFAAVIPANSSQTVARAYPAQPGGFRFTWQQSLEPGDMTAMPDPGAAYRLPFADGAAFVISQAAGGNASTHRDVHNRHAVDFTMPVGTPVVAARDGLVVDMQTDRTAGGNSPELLSQANYVTLLHSDGVLSEYAHLNPGEVVRMGRWVTAGTVIGYSGNTGYSSGPHLHFNAYVVRLEAGGGLGRESLPIAFYVGSSPVRFGPRERLLVTADYSPSPVLPIEIPEPRAPGIRQSDAGAEPAADPAQGAAKQSRRQGIARWVLEHPWLGIAGALLAMVLMLRVFKALVARLRAEG